MSILHKQRNVGYIRHGCRSHTIIVAIITVTLHTDLAYLKDPPPEYPFPPLDIFASLAAIKSNIKKRGYENEYQFQAELYRVFADGHDGHFIFYPDLLTKAFDWVREVSLVLLSMDGYETPKIYLTSK